MNHWLRTSGLGRHLTFHMANNVSYIFMILMKALQMVGFKVIFSNSQQDPEELQNSNNAKPYEESTISSNSRDEINPSLAWLCGVLHDCGAGKEDIKDCNILFISIV